MSEHEKYLNDRQVGERLGVHRKTIWHWAKAGTFPKPIKLSVNCTRWRLSEVEAFERQRAAQSEMA